MAVDETGTTSWQESDSAFFLERGRIVIPDRDRIARTFVDLIPAHDDDGFCGVEIGHGQGWLMDALLRHYPHARMIGVDGSEAMRVAATAALAPHAGRFDLRPFRLEDDTWLDAITEPVRCFVSCLVIHHLDGPGKQALFATLSRHLEPGGALLIADIVAPTSAWGRRMMARGYDDSVRRQSLAFTGSSAIFEQFEADHWNIFTYPDPEFDKPSTVPEQLGWLTEAGFTGVDVFWAAAGHALFGGYKG
ncbi:MAG: class I SAM-dependent methyltransferase [Thermomicrobia bacterium]|nr:class I SAM-dependent methyltransferase [Thermomicrobia bacterium]